MKDCWESFTVKDNLLPINKGVKSLKGKIHIKEFATFSANSIQDMQLEGEVTSFSCLMDNREVSLWDWYVKC